jgi:hypothetical protein
MKNWYLLIVFVYLLIACQQAPQFKAAGGKESQGTLFNHFATSVALLENKFYYEVLLMDGQQFYATSTASGELILHLDEEQAKLNARSVYGTAFFISEEGHCVTNRHVLDPEDTFEGMEEKMMASIHSYDLQIPGHSGEIRLLNSEVLQEDSTWEQPIHYPIAGVQKIEKKYFDLNLTLNDHCENLTKKKLPCTIVKIADDWEIDLAILKIEAKDLEGIKIQPLSIEEKEIEFMSNDSPIYLLGLQVSLGKQNTISCLNPEIMEGSHYISTHPKVARYKINTLPGSSGSPVVNAKGELLAINFAKTTSLEGWSLGIPRSYIHELFTEALRAELQ